MSRIGKLPVSLPSGVSAELLAGNVLKVKGPHGEMTQKVDPDITVTIEDNQIKFARPTDQPRHRSMHGLYRALAHNMVVGVSEGYKKELKLVGIGFRTAVKGNTLTLTVGYSHQVEMEIPAGLEVTCLDAAGKVSPTDIQIKGIDKQLVGQFAAEVRAVRKPEPYKGKGIRYKDEAVRRKEGKTAGKK